MTSKLNRTISTVRATLDAAQAFADKYGPLVPEDFPAYLSLYDNAKLHTFLHDTYGLTVAQKRANMDRLLSAAGKAFGTDGWMRHINHERNSYDWKKLLDGVEITIANAESLGDLTPTPVFPSQFPLLLEDSAEVPA